MIFAPDNYFRSGSQPALRIARASISDQGEANPTPTISSAPSPCVNVTGFNSSTNYIDNCTRYIPAGQNDSVPVGMNVSNVAGHGQGPGPSSSHWWYGAEFNGATASSLVMSAVILVPHDVPVKGEYYYLSLLSAYDSNFRYDQLGIISNYGATGGFPSSSSDSFQVSWQALGACGGTNGTYRAVWGTDWDTGVATLNAGWYYNFTMSISATTHIVTYTVYEVLGGGPTGSELVVWQYQHYTGGSYFQIEKTTTCNGTAYSGYTVYEEHYTTVPQDDPNWGVYIYQTMTGLMTTSWTSYSAGSTPSGLYEQLAGSHVFLYNEYFSLNFTYYWIGSSPGNTVTDAGWVDNNDPGSCGCSVSSLTNVGVYPSNPGLTITFTPTSGSPHFYYNMTVVVSSSATPGAYYIENKAASSGLNAYTTVQVGLYIGTYVGGGCLASGTLVLTSAGEVSVNTLSVGGTVKGYNLTSHSMPTENITGITTTTGDNYLVDINNGQLQVTALDQPIYILNASFTGWLTDPQNLTPGEFVKDPTNGNWIPITNLTTTSGSVTVYDLQVSGLGTFIVGDPILTEKKLAGG
jgi:hypothetical protein